MPGDVQAAVPTATSWHKQSGPQPSFHLHGFGPFDFRREMSTYLNAMALRGEAYRSVHALNLGSFSSSSDLD